MKKIKKVENTNCKHDRYINVNDKLGVVLCESCGARLDWISAKQVLELVEDYKNKIYELGDEIDYCRGNWA